MTLALGGILLRVKSIPRGLKPESFCFAFFGTAKAEPFQNKIFPNLEMRLPWLESMRTDKEDSDCFDKSKHPSAVSPNPVNGKRRRSGSYG